MTGAAGLCHVPEAAVAAGQLAAGGEEEAAGAHDRSSWAVPREVGAAGVGAAQLVAFLDQSEQSVSQNIDQSEQSL